MVGVILKPEILLVAAGHDNLLVEHLSAKGMEVIFCQNLNLRLCSMKLRETQVRQFACHESFARICAL